MLTPALASANTGMITYATHGCNDVNSRSTGESRSVRLSITSSPRWPPSRWNMSATTLIGIHSRSDGRDGVSNPSTTPATVGWMPDLTNASQMTAPTTT